MTASNRMRLTTDAVTGVVTIRYTDWLGHDRERTFTTTRPAGLSYVIEVDARGQYPQVCDRLASTGSTLMAERATLAAKIRREYRAMRRAEAALDRR